MSLKPIDYQVMLPKTNEVSRDLSGQMSKYNAIQRQQANRIKEDSEVELKQVRDREKIQGMRIKERDDNRSNHEKKKQKNRQEPDKEKEKLSSRNGKGTTIDIRL